MNGELERRWKVGELAKATGLTVRTLHHYDDVGLLVASERTSAGHRLYAEQDVRRLYRILALRRLGMRLDEIAAVLDDEGLTLLETVRRHLEQVERELERQQTLRERLRRLFAALERSVEPSAGEFIGAIEAMTVVEAEVEDVLVRVPAEEADEPPPRLGREGYRTVLLKEREGEQVLPIFIRAHEGGDRVSQEQRSLDVRRVGLAVATRGVAAAKRGPPRANRERRPEARAVARAHAGSAFDASSTLLAAPHRQCPSPWQIFTREADVISKRRSGTRL